MIRHARSVFLVVSIALMGCSDFVNVPTAPKPKPPEPKIIGYFCHGTIKRSLVLGLPYCDGWEEPLYEAPKVTTP